MTTTMIGFGGIALNPGMDHSSLQAQKGTAKKSKGAFFEWLDQTEKDKEEHEMRKREKMNEIFAKRMREKQVMVWPMFLLLSYSVY